MDNFNEVIFCNKFVQTFCLKMKISNNFLELCQPNICIKVNFTKKIIVSSKLKELNSSEEMESTIAIEFLLTLDLRLIILLP